MDVAVAPDSKDTLLGLAVAPIPEAEALTESVTVFENPFRLVREMLDVPEDCWAIVIELGLALRLKSTTLTVMVRGCERGPLVPTIVTVYVCATLELTVRVVLPDEPAVTKTLPWLRLSTSPVGDADVETRIVPE